jgi:nitrilase
MGVVERSETGTGTLYCTVLYLSPEGRLLGKHRKLKPTAGERLIWGEGDGSTLVVVDSPYGRIGGLICWENYMPLARAAMYAKGVDLWVAPTLDEREVWQCTLRHIANEGRCFVLSAIQYLTKSMYPGDLACQSELDSAPDVLCAGGSAIVTPLGDYVAGPFYGGEGIVYGDVDLEAIARSRFDFDTCGHYSRPDVFELVVDERPKTGLGSRGRA